MTESEASATVAKLMAETAQINTEAVRALADIRRLNVETPRIEREILKLELERRKLYLEIVLYPFIALSGIVAATIGVTVAVLKLSGHVQ